MIQYFTFSGKKVESVAGLANAKWIHVSSPLQESEIEDLASNLEIPIDFITDSLDIDERSRYEREDDSKLILINTPLINNSDKENEAFYITVPIGVIIKEDWVLTISQKENLVIEKILSNKIKNFNPINKTHFVLHIFEQNVYWFLECLKSLNLKRNLIEEELYDSSRNSELRQLLKIEKSLVYFVNSLNANDLLMLKMKRTDFLGIRNKDPHEDLFEDIIIDNGQALEMSNVYTNILSSTMEAYASIISNNLNTFIHRLTVITIILMVPTLVASFFGMNFTHIPFKEYEHSFSILIILSVFVGFLLVKFIGKKAKK